jgi:hypothetical protein
MLSACFAGDGGVTSSSLRLWICQSCRDLWTNVQNAPTSSQIGTAACVSHIRPQLPWKTGVPQPTPPVSHSSLEILAPGLPPTRIPTAPQPRRLRSVILSKTERRSYYLNPKLNRFTREGFSSSLRSDWRSDSIGIGLQFPPDSVFRFVGIRSRQGAPASQLHAWCKMAWEPER